MSRFICPTCLDSSDDEVKKKVTFSDNVKVFYIESISVVPDVCWMTIARDRLRFQRRIKEIEKRICWIFDYDHRLKIEII